MIDCARRDGSCFSAAKTLRIRHIRRDEHDLDKGTRGFASLNWYWRSEVNDSLGDPKMVRGDYGLLGGALGVLDADGRWEVSIWARNLLDQHYTGTIVTTPLSPGSYSQYPVEDARRMVGVTLTYRMAP